MVPQSTDFRCERTRRKQYAPPRRRIKMHLMFELGRTVMYVNHWVHRICAPPVLRYFSRHRHSLLPSRPAPPRRSAARHPPIDPVGGPGPTLSTTAQQATMSPFIQPAPVLAHRLVFLFFSPITVAGRSYGTVSSFRGAFTRERDDLHTVE